MTINWYPGHMHRARKDIVNALKKIDVLVEIVDARLPFSSQNPLINPWRASRPTVVVLSKTDLADPQLTREWQDYFVAEHRVKTLAYHRGDQAKLQQISQLCVEAASSKRFQFKTINAMVLGIPNVGKSTLINALVGKSIAKVGNEPAVTKSRQRVVLNDRVVLHDTPGILWPKIDNPHSGYRLAIAGSIRNTAIDYEDIGYYAAEYLLAAYPQRLLQRYQLQCLPTSAVNCLESVGARRGARRGGGRIDLHKVAEILIHDLRSGNLGAITLETPAMVAEEMNAVAAEKHREAEKKAVRDQALRPSAER